MPPGAATSKAKEIAMLALPHKNSDTVQIKVNLGSTELMYMEFVSKEKI